MRSGPPANHPSTFADTIFAFGEIFILQFQNLSLVVTFNKTSVAPRRKKKKNLLHNILTL